MEARLNLGCGTDTRPGYVNLDIAALPGVDLVRDLSQLPLPFPDDSFEEVLALDILEHVDHVAVMRELHRILRPGGRLRLRSPHFTSRAVYLDPTHRTAYSIDTFRFFSRGAGRDYYFDFAFSAIEEAHIDFHRYRWQPWNYAVEWLVNRTAAARTYYEDTALARLFPAANVRVTLVK
jgi:predicted SAM-dependent methyltransferase